METVLAYAIPSIITVLATLITQAIISLLAKVAAKTTDQHKLDLLDAVASFAQDAVMTAEQTVVDSLKKTGKWGTPDSYRLAMEAALTALKTKLPAILPGLAKQGVELGEDFLRQLIEAQLKKIT